MIKKKTPSNAHCLLELIETAPPACLNAFSLLPECQALARGFDWSMPADAVASALTGHLTHLRKDQRDPAERQALRILRLASPRGAKRVAADDRHVHDVTLLEGVARGFYWQHLVDTGVMKSGSDIARAEGLHPLVPNELMRLTLLAPDILELLMTGRQPRRMNLIWFQRNPLPVDWEAQRQIVKRFEEDV